MTFQKEDYNKVLTLQEIDSLLGALNNSTQRLLIRLLYSTGLSPTELVRLQVQHVDLSKTTANVPTPKKKSTKQFTIPDSIIDELVNHIVSNCPTPSSFLFIARNREPLSVTDINIILKKASTKAKLTRKVTPYLLKISFMWYVIKQRKEWCVQSQ